MVVKHSCPVWPLNQAVRGGVVDKLAPFVVGSARCLWRPQAAVDAVGTASEQDDLGELKLEWKVVDNETV